MNDRLTYRLTKALSFGLRMILSIIPLVQPEAAIFVGPAPETYNTDGSGHPHKKVVSKPAKPATTSPATARRVRTLMNQFETAVSDVNLEDDLRHVVANNGRELEARVNRVLAQPAAIALIREFKTMDRIVFEKNLVRILEGSPIKDHDTLARMDVKDRMGVYILRGLAQRSPRVASAILNGELGLPSEFNVPFRWSGKRDIRIRPSPLVVQGKRLDQGKLPSQFSDLTLGASFGNMGGLTHALMYGQDRVANHLVKVGDINAPVTDGGTTTLMWLASDAHLPAIKKFFELAKAHGKRIDVNARSKDGESALMWCFNTKTSISRPDKHEILRYLIQQGVDVNLADNAGKTPLSEALDLGDQRSAAILIRAGAKKP